MENHSFDNLLGMVPSPGRRTRRSTGCPRKHGNASSTSTRISPAPNSSPRHARVPCQLARPSRARLEQSHLVMGQRMQRRVRQGERPIAMRFWDGSDLVHVLARRALPDRPAVLLRPWPGPTEPRFFFTGAACGTIATDSATFHIPAANRTIFDHLDAHHVDSADLRPETSPSWLIIPDVLTPRARAASADVRPVPHRRRGRQACHSSRSSTRSTTTTSEENPQDIQVGERFVAQVVHAADARPDVEAHGPVHHLRRARRLLRPRPPAPRDQARRDPADDSSRATFPARYDRYGFRVPLIVVSPVGARRLRLPRVTQDLTRRSRRSSSASGTCPR